MAIDGNVGGHVYVFNRELHRQQKSALAVLLFPNANQDNRLEPGHTVAVPGVDVTKDYYTIGSRDPATFLADQLILVIARDPLGDELLAGGEAFDRLCDTHLSSTIEAGAGGGKVRINHRGASDSPAIRVLQLKVLIEQPKLKKGGK